MQADDFEEIPEHDGIVGPGIAAVAMYNIIRLWHEFLFALVFLQSNKLFTLPLGLAAFEGDHSFRWDLLMAGASSVSLPILVVFLVMNVHRARLAGRGGEGLKRTANRRIPERRGIAAGGAAGLLWQFQTKDHRHEIWGIILAVPVGPSL